MKQIYKIYKLYIICGMLCFLHGFLYGFGKNKVQYHYFKFKILKTAHFDIYYEKGEELLATETAKILEFANADLSKWLRY